MLRLWFIALALVIVLPAAARTQDDLARFAQRNKLLREKLTEDARKAISQSRLTEKSDPAAARTSLESILTEVRNSEVLVGDARTDLESQIKSRIRGVDEAARRQRIADGEAARVAAQKRVITPRDLGAGPSAAQTAERFIQGSRATQADADRRRTANAQGVTDTIRAIQDSSRPIAGNIEFSKNWASLSESRKRFVGPHMSEKEGKLLKSLAEPISVKFQNHTFKEALEYLMDKTNQPIIVDETALKDVNVDYDDKITLEIPRAAFRTVLKTMLANKGLAYVIREGTIQVVTQQRAREMMTVRTYPIDDLLLPDPQVALFGGPFAAQAQRRANAQAIAQMIQQSVEPAQWSTNGGQATISFFEPGGALIIRASAEMHMTLSNQGFGGR